MKKEIKEYLELSNQEKNKLWQNATFVFDTNVFCDLYRYSIKTKNALLSAFDTLKDRLWMPKQIAYEYMKDRISIVNEKKTF
mgnify:CR=1 FL=1